MKVENVMKVIDVPARDVDEKLIMFLENHYVIYRDTVLKEHLCDVNGAVEELEEGDLPNKLIEQLNKLNQLAAENDAAYVRFTVI